jgi:hypothetical protein
MNILGIIASSKLGVVPGDFESIATVTVGSGGSASVLFDNIATTWTHLQVRFLARTTRVATSEDINLQLNGDTGNNYSWHIIYGDGTNPVVSAAASTFRILVPSVSSANATASIFGAGVVDILDYKDTNKYKTVRSLGGSDRNGAGEIMFESGNWRNTNAISSLTFTPAAASNFAQYSHFALYGIRSA